MKPNRVEVLAIDPFRGHVQRRPRCQPGLLDVGEPQWMTGGVEDCCFHRVLLGPAPRVNMGRWSY